MIRLGIRVRAADAEIAFARLEPVLAAGAEEVTLDGAIEFAVYDEDVPDARLRALGGDTILDVVRTPVADGWDRAWHEHLQPVTVGALTVRPPWLAGGDSDIVIDPGTTFGAASHPSTRLCLELLQELPGRGPLADWGCGSGVLAIAAARLGFAPVVAVELDPSAAAVARANAEANGEVVEVIVGDVTRSAPWAPTIVANLTLPLLEATARALPAGTEGGATMLVASGVLAAHADALTAVWVPVGFTERERRVTDGWAALVLERL